MFKGEMEMVQVSRFAFGASRPCDFCFRIVYPDSGLWRITVDGRFYKGFNRSFSRHEFDGGSLITLVLPFVLLAISNHEYPSKQTGGTDE